MPITRVSVPVDSLPEFVWWFAIYRCLPFTFCTDPHDSIWNFYLEARILGDDLCNEFSDLPL